MSVAIGAMAMIWIWACWRTAEMENDPLANILPGGDDEENRSEDGSDAGWDMEDMDLPAADLVSGSQPGSPTGIQAGEMFVAPSAAWTLDKSGRPNPPSLANT